MTTFDIPVVWLPYYYIWLYNQLQSMTILYDYLILTLNEHLRLTYSTGIFDIGDLIEKVIKGAYSDSEFQTLYISVIRWKL